MIGSEKGDVQKIVINYVDGMKYAVLEPDGVRWKVDYFDPSLSTLIISIHDMVRVYTIQECLVWMMGLSYQLVAVLDKIERRN